MSQISELRKTEYFEDATFTCLCCGEPIKHGGVYRGTEDIAICSDCIHRSSFRPLGIMLGDAILDKYARGHPVDTTYTTTLVRSVLQRMESAIYRVVADGLFNKHVRKAS